MTGGSWTEDELARIGAADELEVAPVRADGSMRRPLPIWVVRVGDELYVRSWRGEDGAWYRAAKSRREGHVSSGGVEFVDADDSVNDAVEAAYRDKYARYPRYVEPMVSTQARATTLRLVAHGDAR